MKNLLLKHEKELFSATFCNSREHLERILSKDFFEYGKSGKIYDRESTISALMSMTKDKNIEISQFEITELHDDVIIVHYISSHRDDNSQALRTSIWRLEDGDWKLLFHQGTPC